MPDGPSRPSTALCGRYRTERELGEEGLHRRVMAFDAFDELKKRGKGGNR